MSRQIEFYFDFMSPYSYLAFQRLPVLAARYGYELLYKPVELSVLKLAAGNTGPATREMPTKLAYAMTDIARWASRYGVPFKVVPGMSLDSELLNKGTFFAIDHGQAQEYVAAAWAASFGAGGSMNDQGLLASVARLLGWHPDTFLHFVRSKEAMDRYTAVINEAQSKKIFGVPTMRLNDIIWWGNDRLDFVEEHLQEAQEKAGAIRPAATRNSAGI